MFKCARLTFVALASLLATTTHARQFQPAAGSVFRQTTAIDRVLSEAVMRKDIPGVVAIATDRREIIYRGAFGLGDGRDGRR